MTTSSPQSIQFDTSKTGRVVTLSIDHDDVKTISRYRNTDTFRSIKQFVQEAVDSSVRWMQRMINGEELFCIDSMDYWEYTPTLYRLKLKGTPSNLRSNVVIFDMAFTKGSLAEYNQGLASILNGFWYKTAAFPPAVVELIACCDILYRQHHNNVSPAAASKVPHADLKA